MLQLESEAFVPKTQTTDYLFYTTTKVKIEKPIAIGSWS